VSCKLFVENGIENVTKEMIADASGLSRKSIDRYFEGKADCVIRIMEWLLYAIRDSMTMKYPHSIFTDGEHSGAELLRKYMVDIKAMFLKWTNVFVLFSEYRNFVYRNSNELERRYTDMLNMVGSHRIRMRIFTLGMEDGTLRSDIDARRAEHYFVEMYLGYLSQLATSGEDYSEEEKKMRLDIFINMLMTLFTKERVSLSDGEAENG
jgi:AcrR family transcriptional regulator